MTNDYFEPAELAVLPGEEVDGARLVPVDALEALVAPGLDRPKLKQIFNRFVNLKQKYFYTKKKIANLSIS